MKVVYYKTRIADIPSNSVPFGYTVLKFNKYNIHKWSGLFTLCIELFYSEREWNKMWNIEEAATRIKTGDDFYVMFKVTDLKSPIAYLWVKGNFIYNVFVHSSKPKNSSVLFMQEVIHTVTTEEKYIEWNTDDWNIAAMKLWDKVGAKKII